MGKSYFSKVTGFYRSSHRRCSVKESVLRKVFAKCTGKHLSQRLYFNKVTGLRLWYKSFPFQFSKISESIFFTQHLRTTASGFSFSETATGSVLWKKVFLKTSQNLQENTCGLRNFQEHHFYRTPLDDYFWLSRATILKWSTANSVWKTSDEYSLSRNFNSRSNVQIHHFFLGSINFRCMFSLIYTV